jgi:hypothetical protein
MRKRLTNYVARVGLLRAAANLGVARHTLERALGGLRVIRAIERQMLDVLDRDDRAQAPRDDARIIGRLHAQDADLSGEFAIVVGFCTFYEGGPRVLLSFLDRNRGVSEFSISPKDARELAMRLVDSADRLMVKAKAKA